MAKSKFTEAQLEEIKGEFKDKSKLYDYRSKDYSLEVMLSKYGEEDNENTTMFVPDYQREYVWKNHKKSKFIESVFLGMPLTPFLVSEDEKARLEIVDGSQRIRTLISFYKNEFSLIGLKKLPKLNRAKFKDLPQLLQRTLMNRDFRIIVVEDSTEQVRKDLFERLNTTAEGLRDAEIRKGSYSGLFYDMVLDFKEKSSFTQVCTVTEAKKQRGEYEELILRYLIYSRSYLEVTSEVANFLNENLQKKNDEFEQASEEDREQKRSSYEEDFNTMVSFVDKYFKAGFSREERGKGGVPRVRFEAISVGVHLALKENPSLENPNMDWLGSEGFKQTTTSDASNNPYRLKDRIEFVRDGLLGNLTEERLSNG